MEWSYRTYQRVWLSVDSISTLSMGDVARMLKLPYHMVSGKDEACRTASQTLHENNAFDPLSVSRDSEASTDEIDDSWILVSQ